MYTIFGYFDIEVFFWLQVSLTVAGFHSKGVSQRRAIPTARGGSGTAIPHTKSLEILSPGCWYCVDKE
jgi:hypothetical protein